MPWTDYPWADTPAGGTPILASVLKSEFARVASGTPYENVLWHGAVGNNTGDQTAEIQAALDACEATGGTVFIPRGVYRMLGSLELHEHVSLIGEGEGASILSWPTSLGAGTWALTPDLTIGLARFGRISSLSFSGPGAGATIVPGTPVSDMNGVKISDAQLLEHCRVFGFHRNVGVSENHLEITNCHIFAGTYNIAWLAGELTSGDLHFTSVAAAGASIASLYVEATTGISASLFSGVHMGYAPYGILSAAGKAGANFIERSTFIESPIESFGTAAIWGSNATDIIVGSRFGQAGSGGWWQNPVYALPATSYEFTVRSGTIERCVFDADLISHAPTVPGTAYFSASGAGSVALEGLEFLHGGHQLLVDNNTRFLHRTSGGAAHFCSFSGPDSRRGTFCYAVSAVTQGQLVKGGNFGCGVYDDDTLVEAPLGVALQSGAGGEIIAVVTEGYSTGLVADGTITQGRFLKPAATNGRVVQAASWADGPIVGVAHSSATIGQAIDAHIRLGTWG